MARRLLALDIATTTGIAWAALDEIPRAEVISFKGTSDDDIWCSATKWLNELLKVAEPDVVAIEAPILSSAPAGGSNPTTLMRLLGLQAVVRTVVALRLPVIARLINVQSARKFFIGKGNLPGEQAKRLVKARCIDLGWLTNATATYDKADAMCVWAKAAADLDPKLAASLTPLAAAAAMQKRGQSVG